MGEPCNESLEIAIPGAEGVVKPEGRSAYAVYGQGVGAPGGITDHGARKEDGPGTWEALHSPCEVPAHGRAGEQTSYALRGADLPDCGQE